MLIKQKVLTSTNPNTAPSTKVGMHVLPSYPKAMSVILAAAAIKLTGVASAAVCAATIVSQVAFTGQAGIPPIGYG